MDFSMLHGYWSDAGTRESLFRASAPGDDAEGGRLLADRLDEFDAGQDEVTLNVFAKKDKERGGLLDLLRAASPVAPAVLPDVILLSDADLAVAAREGLIQPL